MSIPVIPRARLSTPQILAILHARTVRITSSKIQSNRSHQIDHHLHEKITYKKTTKMMNLLALGLVLTSLVTAGFFNPSPEKQRARDDNVIVKEGHRVVVVEYEKDDGNTKVSIAPQDSQPSHEKGVVDKLTDKMSEKIGDLGGKVKNQEEEIRHKYSPGELVCDAYGKCKRIVASAVGKTKEAVAETADVEKEAASAVGDAVGKAKDMATDKAHKVFDKVQETKESVKDSANEASRKAKDKLAGKAQKAEELTKEKLSAKAKRPEQWVESTSDRVKKEGQKELSEIVRHAREVAVEVFNYVFSPERVAPLASVLHLMGFAAAYGMCVWVTFASSYVLAGSLPRHQFAMVQSKIYPVYFKAMAHCVGMALLGYLMNNGKWVWPLSVGLFRGFELMASLVMILVNLMYLEPRASKVMIERMKKEKEEGRGKEGEVMEGSNKVVDSAAETGGRASKGGTSKTHGATQEQPTSKAHGATRERPEEVAAKAEIVRLGGNLQRLNSYSSLLNVMTLVSLTWHLVCLSQRLHTVC